MHAMLGQVSMCINNAKQNDKQYEYELQPE